MIPRFCEAKHVTQAYTTEDVSRIVKDAVNSCKGKRYMLHSFPSASHQLSTCCSSILLARRLTSHLPAACLQQRHLNPKP